MSFNYDDALKEIEEIHNLTNSDEAKQRIINLINNLDISADGDVTVLYSGLNDGVNIKDLVDGNVRLLDNTDAARILNSDDFKELVNEVIGGLERGEAGNKFLFDVPGGAWDNISNRFVRDGSGEILTIIGENAELDRTFYNTEWKAVKEMPQYDKINDKPRDTFLKEMNTLNDYEKLKQFQVETINRDEIANKLNKKINTLTENDMTEFYTDKDGKNADVINNIQSRSKNLLNEHTLVKISKFFNKLGVVGTGLGFMLASAAAAEAHELGDTQKAQDIMTEWAVDEAGSAAGGAVGAVIGGVALAVIGALGATVAAPLAIVIVAAASIAGAFAGSDLAKYLYNEFDNLYDKFDDFLQKLSKLSFQSIFDMMGVGSLDSDNPNHNFLDLIPKFLWIVLRLDPLVLDMDKDGYISNIPLEESNAYFDITGDGIRENISWIGSEDGILVYDKNQNNVIDGINEVFGNGGINIYDFQRFSDFREELLLDGVILGTIDNSTLNQSLNGFDELKFVVDTNGDGKIDRKDELYNQLKIWHDKNADGRASEDELDYLIDADIKSISLNYINSNIELGGSTLSQASKYIDSTGNQELAADLNLEYNPILTTVDIEDIPDFSVDPVTNNLPHLKGYGVFIDTFIAYNINDELKNKAIEFSQDISKVATQFNEFIEIWSGYRGYINSIKEKYNLQGDIELSDIDKKTWISERLVNTLVFTSRIEKNFEDICKKYIDKDVSNVTVETVVPDGRLSNYYNEYYHEEVLKRYEGSFALNAFYSFDDLNYDSSTGRFLVDETKMSSFYTQLADYFNDENNTLEQKIYLSKIMNMQRGRFILFNDEIILNLVNDKTIKELLEKGFLQDDRTIHVYEKDINLIQNNALVVGSEEDEIIKLSGDNTIVLASKGDDVLISAQGDNKYIFRAGDGSDIIHDAKGYDTLVFDGILKQDAVLSYENENLIITTNSDRVVIQNWIKSLNRIENIIFDNDEIITSDEIISLLMITPDADYIEAGLNDDTIDSLEGDDTILGLEGDDTLIGNKGNDNLQGGIGNDTYIYNIGDGIDTIYDIDGEDTLSFGENISKDDLIIKLIGNDLIIGLKEDGKIFDELTDKIIMKDWELLPTRIEKIEFNDESFLYVQDIYLPTENDDSLIFSDEGIHIDMLSGDDTLITGAGDDVVYGNNGNDILSTGMGNDTLIGGFGEDTLKGGLGDDVYIFAIGDGKDIIDDSYYFGYNNSRSEYAGIDTIKFSEGITIDNLEVQLIENNIVIGIKEEGKSFEEYADTITIKNWLDKDKTIENIELSDGTKVKLQDLQQATQFDDVLIYDSSDVIVDALEGNDTVLTGDGNNTIYGNEGEDYIQTGSGNDILDGGLGNDNLFSSEGDDILEGGKHNDNLEGGKGNDTYIFNRGDGSDIIYDNYISTWLNIQVDAGNDSLKFGEGITLTDLIAMIIGTDLVIGIKENEKNFEDLTDKITIKDWTNSNNRIENLKFFDGSTTGFDSIIQATINDDYLVFGDEGVIIDALAGDDQVISGNGNDIVIGGSGNDILSTSDGDDILTGGLGNDTLYGGSGKDIYIFNKGDGIDTIYDIHTAYNREDEKDDSISFGDSISFDDIEVKLVGKDMILAIKEDGKNFDDLDDKIIIKDWTVSDNKRVENVVFSDGSKVNVETLQSATLEDDYLVYESEITIDALDGNDTVVTSNGDDTLIGGKGNDSLYGQLGDDKYIFNRGDGIDTIIDSGGIDSVIFGIDILESDLIFRRTGDDLLIGIYESGKDFSQLGDKLIIKSWFLLNNNIESIEFFDGSILNSDILSSYFVKDNIPGLIYSKPGAILFGESGDDTYVYNKGDFTVTIEDSIFEGEIEVNAGNDKLLLSGGINKEDVVFSTFGDDLIINIINAKDTYEELKDRVLIKDWQNENRGIEQIVFSNGEILDIDKTEIYEEDTNFKEEWYPINHYIYGDNDNQISRGSNVIIEANAGNDTVISYGGDDKLYGGEGDDTLISNEGKDFLDGGTGKDQLQAGKGNDTYFYGRGYGHDTITDEYFFYSSNQDAGIDTIRFQSGITLNDLIFQQYNNDLIIAIKEDGKSFNELTDKLTIKNWNDTNYKIESLLFSDGSYIGYKNIFDLMDKSFDDYISTSEKAESVTEELSLGFFNAVSDIAALGEDADKLTEVSVDLVGEVLNMENVNANDEVYGGEGNDTIITREGIDILDGGTGNDRLEGGRRNDVYIYGKGYGHDTILDNYKYYHLDQDGGNDVIRFKEGIVASDLIFKQKNNDLIVAIKEDGKSFEQLSDTLTIENWNDSNFTIENFVFSDGSTLVRSDIHLSMITEGDDVITTSQSVDFSLYSFAAIFFNPDKSIPILESFDAHDIIYGGLGNDTISTGEGNDKLDGGEGNDILNGGGHNDTYIFGKGYGHDIVLDEYFNYAGIQNAGNDELIIKNGLTIDDLIFKQINNDLIIGIKEDGKTFDELTDKLTITNWNDTYYSIENIIFESGSTLSKEEVRSLMQKDGDDIISTGENERNYGHDIILGGAGNDSISTRKGNDTLDGGIGNDLLQGGENNDTYIFGRGYGQDQIIDVGAYYSQDADGNIDTINFIGDLSQNDLILKQKDNELIIGIKEDGKTFDELTDKLTITNWNNTYYSIENLVFSNGTIITKDEIYNIMDKTKDDNINTGNGSDTVYGGEGSDIIYTYGGNDVIYGEDEVDTIVAGKGDDTIYGGLGDDVYIFNIGDGQDTLIDSNGKNIISFGEGIKSSQIKYTRYGSDLFILKLDSADKIVVEDWFINNNELEIQFNDNTIVKKEQILANLTDGNNNDLDTENTFVSSKNITIHGETGNDTYNYNKGDSCLIIEDKYSIDGTEVQSGSDSLVLNGGINFSDIILNQYKDDLVIKINYDESIDLSLQDYILVKNWKNENQGIEKIIFSNGDILEIDKSLIYEETTINENLLPNTNHLYGYEDNEVVGNDSNENYSLGKGNDTISTNGGSDIIYGGEDNDNISSGYGNDILDGGSGDDYLNGWGDNDTYIFGRGYGQDTIIDYLITSLSGQLVSGGSDTIQFNEGITVDDLIFMQKDNELIIGIKEDGKTFEELSDKLTITNWQDINYRIENIKFYDDTFLSFEDIHSSFIISSDDNISTNGGSDIVYGGAGNDNISSGYGNDTLDGGAGNDQLNGWGDNDTYIFGRGYGQDTIIDYLITSLSGQLVSGGSDTIQFNEGITVDDLIFMQKDNELIIGIKEDEKTFEELTDKLTIRNWQDVNYKIENIKFSDDTLLTFEDIQSLTIAPNDDTISTNGGSDIIYGGAGNDNISSGYGNDILDGGSGDDYLNGWGDNDTYIFGRGYGQDTIIDYRTNMWGVTDGGNDTIQLKEGITVDDLIFMQKDNELIIGIKEDEKTFEELTDKLTIRNWQDVNYKIENIKFSDDTLLTFEDIQSLTIAPNDDAIVTGYGSDVIYGGEGNDDIFSSDGNDILDGGSGDDVLKGWKDNDTYIFGRGYGQDTIIDYRTNMWGVTDGGNDTIQLKEGITVDDLIFMQKDNNLIIAIKEDDKIFEELSDKLILTNWQDTNYRIENIKFLDGTLLTFTDEQANYTLTEPTESSTPPIVLDMNFNGTTSISLENSNAYFDYAADGKKEHTAWIESGDALLVADLNNDGIINDGSELFGNYTKLANGTFASDGYEALAQYDSNSDLIIDYKDDNYSKLSLWNDLNQNGKTDAGELQNIQLSVVTAIHLTNSDNTIFEQVTENGNLITNETEYETNSENGKLRDIWFEYDEANYITNNDTLQATDTQKYLSLKDGNDTYIYSLGDGLVTIDDAGNGEDTLKFTQGIKKEQIEVRWNKNTDDIILSIRPTIDDTTAVTELEDQILIKNWFNDTGSIEIIQFSDGTILNKEQLFEILTSKKETSSIITRVFTENGQLEGGIFNDVLYGSSGSELLDGKDGHDYLKGLEGDDQLIGGYGDDTHFAGSGNDLSTDIDGDEYYIYNRGDGQDTIIDANGNDTIVFGADIVKDDLVIKEIEDTLVIALKEDGVDFEQLQDTITIENYSNDNYKIENLEFSNGEIVNLDGSSNSTTDKQIVLDNIEVTLQEDNTISGSLQIEGNTDGIQFTVESVLENSNLQIDELGNYTYTPNQDYNGTEQISVSVINKYGETSFATLTFIVETVNDTPIAKEDTAEVVENGTLTIQSIEILSNDIDVDTNDILTITNVEVAAENKGIVSLIDGNVVFETGTAFDYLAEGESEVVILNYEMQDDKGASSSSTISVTVTGTNDAPVISTIQTVNTLEDANILTGQIEAIDVDNNSSLIFTTTQIIAGFTLNENGSYSFNPSSEEYQTLSQGDEKEIIIPITVTDENGSADIKDLIIKVIGTNDTPIAKEDTAEVVENGTLTIQSIDILSNDIDVDTNNILTITNVEVAENKGVVSLVDGNVVFETGTAFDYLAEGESEVVTLNYEIQDDKGASSSSTISITVTGTNDAPIVNFPLEEITLTQELTKSGQIQASDIDNDVLTYTIVENAKHGEFKVDENGMWKYNVDSTYSGEDSVIVQIDDLNGGIVTKTLNFNVDNNVKNGDDRTNFLFGSNEKNILNGLGGDDFIFALRGDDMILGGEGNDIIFAAQGDDMIWGGKGDDILQGHTGNDTYIFNIGDGNDIIFEYKSRNSSDINRILFGENITAENIKFEKDNNNLIIKVSENDSIKIMNWYTNQDDISEIVFDDGTKLLNSEILEKVALEGTSRKDTLRGTNTEDNMYALEGDDRVYGYGGNDLLNGGKGDDYLRGGDGDDIYSFSLGDGNDTIVEEGNIFNWNNDNKNDTVQFDNTISATDILFTWDRNNLIINYSDNDSIKIDNQKRGYKDIENFKLSDGSYLTNDDVEILIQNMTSFAAENDIDLTNRNEVKNNSELMNIVTNAWHHAS